MHKLKKTMQLIKVFVKSKGLNHAIGNSLTGDNVFVKNGDLLSLTEIESVFIEKKGETVFAEILETYQNDKVICNNIDADNLINTKLIDKIISRNIFVISNKWLFPDKRILGLIEYLLINPDMWTNSKICLNGERSFYFRAKTFGMTFKKTIEKLNKSGLSKARLFCESRNDFTKDGVVAEMLANTSIEKNGSVKLEVWQGVENVHEVFYAHGLMNKEKDSFYHFDCAVIDFDIKDKNRLFSENKKIKSGHYKKLFRIDGCIDPIHIFELANRFFPLDNLIDEYFEIEKI